MNANPQDELVKHLEHCNVIGRIVGQVQIGENLWGISLEMTILSSLFGKLFPEGKARFMVFFDKKIEFNGADAGFQILIRHADLCKDIEDKDYYFICEGIVFHKGPQVKFIADHHTPTAE